MIEKIMEHELVYQLAGKEVPPYRMTYEEHIQLVKDCENIHPLPEPKNTGERYGLIGEYNGVQIQVVAIIGGQE